MAVGIGVLLFLALQIMWVFFAVEATGVVTKVKESQSKGKTYYSITYMYGTPCEMRIDSANVEREDYVRFSGLLKGPEEARQVKLRYFHMVGPLHQARAIEYESAWGLVGFLVFFALFWNGVMSVFVYQMWVVPIRTRRLYEKGDVTTGRVTAKNTVRKGKGTAHRVAYTFTDPVTGEAVSGSVDAVLDRFEQVKEGDAVTVLYRANKPRVNTVYELGGYEVV